MDSQTSHIGENSRRIAKNTVLLYLRMLTLMLIGLFTSRVVMIQLGVTDWGVYNAVAGVVTMFGVVTASLSSAVSRFITFELGRGDSGRVSRAFSSSLAIQASLALVVIILTETLGMWYLGSKMQLPPDRSAAAIVVLQMAMVSMTVNLVAVPYNAVILAHEHMGVFARIGIIEGVLKLAMALLLYLSPSDKLKTYAILLALVSIVVRSIYAAYCRRHFPEVRGPKNFDRGMLRDMAGFAGWNFIGTGAWLFNTQGINQLMNHFFGVLANASYGVAATVDGMVRQFAQSFNNAVNPQIVKSYAAGKTGYCFELVCKGAKFSWLLLLFLTVPFCFETETILNLWFKGIVPASAPLFTRLVLIGTMVDMLGYSLAQLALASGEVRRYYLVVGPVSFLVFLLSWVLYRCGMPASVSYYVFIAVYTVLLGLKLLLMRRMAAFPAGRFVRDVLLRIAPPTIAAVVASMLVRTAFAPSLTRLLLTLLCSTFSICIFAWLFSLEKGEKAYALEKLHKFLRRP